MEENILKSQGKIKTGNPKENVKGNCREKRMPYFLGNGT
jgi:hypothetical protein